ncbi:MAG: DUF4157 domain-containing protein [Alphaproteobacteria bacterium]|nr:DUF4157 domain-containing protein [Alphaproteobacteria bacterium]
MAPSVDSSRHEARARRATADTGVVEAEKQSEAQSESTVDVAATVSQVVQSSYGNAIVQAALSGADIGPLGDVVAGEIAAATAGMGAMSPDGAGLAAAGNAALARIATGAGEGNMTQAEAINEMRGSSGQALPDGVRGRMEKAFGRSFAGVRVHVGGRSAAAAEALNAQAVALGSHIHFGEGHFAPGTTAGDAVIAHELTHVVQAEEGRLPSTGGISDPMMAAEREAYGNESISALSGADVASAVGDALGQPAGVTFASSIETGIAPGVLGLPSLGLGLGTSQASIGAGGDLGVGMMGGAMAAVAPDVGTGAMAAAASAAPASAPAMLREEPSRKEAMRHTDREASIQHELEMGLDVGFERAVDKSQGDGTSNIPKEGTGRREGVFHGPSKSGHHAVNEYMDVMKSISPDGRETRSASDDHIRAPAVHTFTENDGHAHLDGDPKLGAEPEGAKRKTPLPPPSPTSEKKGPFAEPVNQALEDAFGAGVRKLDAKLGDGSAADIGAAAYTKGKEMSFGKGVDPNNARDDKAMEAVGHEVAHALADGGSGKTEVDEPGDEGERAAGDAGKKFAEFAKRGGDAPNLGPAAGGKAKVHRIGLEGDEKKKPDLSKQGKPSGDLSVNKDGEVKGKFKGKSAKVGFGAPMHSEGQVKTVDPADTTSTAVAGDKPVGSAVDLSTNSVTQSYGLGGSAKIGKKVNIGAEVFSKETRTAFQEGKGDPKQRKEMLEKIQDPSDIGALGGDKKLEKGSGMTFTTTDKIGGSAKLLVGGDHARTDTRQMTVARTGDSTLKISTQSSKGQATSISGGPGVLDFGVTDSSQQGKTNTFELDEKKAKPETIKAIHEYQETGLMPGARKLGDKGDADTKKANAASLKQYDTAKASLAKVDAQLRNPNLTEKERNDLVRQRHAATNDMHGARDTLNQAWDKQIGLGGKGDGEVLPGLKLTRQDEYQKQQAGFNASVGAPVVGSVDLIDAKRTKGTGTTTTVDKDGKKQTTAWTSRDGNSGAFSTDGATTLKNGDKPTEAGPTEGDAAWKAMRDSKSQQDANATTKKTLDYIRNGQTPGVPMTQDWNRTSDGREREQRGMIRNQLSNEAFAAKAMPDKPSDVKGMTNAEKYNALSDIAGNNGSFKDLKEKYGPDKAKELEGQYVDMMRKSNFASNPKAAITAASGMTDPKQRAETMRNLYESLPAHRRKEFESEFKGMLPNS